jgi:ankyrin repeat protein
MKRTLTFICALELALAAFAATANRSVETITPEFHNLLRRGDLAGVKEALARGLSPNARDAAGNTVLMQSCIYADLSCAQFLIDQGADVNASNAAGATALMRAAYEFDKVRFLVEHGANVNVRSAFGNTPLMLASRPANSHQAVQYLLAHGANVNATNNWGATALMSATAGGDHETIGLLLKHGANPNAQLVLDHAAFIFAGGRSALMWAAYRGDVKAMQMLVDAGADVNSPGMLGTPLTQATWGDQTAAARFLIKHGANVNAVGQPDGYSPLHWAASTEEKNPALAKLLLANGANPNLEGGQNVDAFMDIPQTPLMLAQRRGDTAILRTLIKAGATNGTPDKARSLEPARPLGIGNEQGVREAVSAAVPLLQQTAIKSKAAFVEHASKQDCLSCHQQFLPMAAVGSAKKLNVSVDTEAEQQLIDMVQLGELKNPEFDWEAMFHPDGAQTKGYALLGEALAEVPANESIDSWVHHLSIIQGIDGRWHNNLPRPPIQTGDIGATALAVHALKTYPLPGRKAQYAKQIERARIWLAAAKPQNTDGRIYQLLGLAWAGESSEKLQPLARALAAEQRNDGGWAQLPGLKADAFATGQAVYALKVGAAFPNSNPVVARGKDWLVRNQLADGSWYVRRRAFPFQPTMQSGFPHGKDSWISAAATSWAVMALSAPDAVNVLATK